MFYLSSPLNQFEVTNLFGFFAPIIGQFNIILTSLAQYTDAFVSNGCSQEFFPLVLITFFVVILTGVGYIFHYSSKIVEKRIKNAGSIGTGVVEVVTGLETALNLADRFTKEGSGNSDSDKNKDLDKKYDNKDNTKTDKTEDTEGSKNLKLYLNYFCKLIKIFSVKNLSINYLDYHRVFILPFLMEKYNPNISPESDPLISYSFSMFILSFIVLLCFYNIVAYLLSIYLIDKYDVENKFPIFKKYIRFYSSTSKFLLVLEIIIAFLFLLFIVGLNFFLFTTILI
jgi:hypothetical protein